MSGTLLGIWAHPDDEAFLSSGLMLAARERGDRVVVATATRGEHGTDDPVSFPPHVLGVRRARELEGSLKVLGVDEHHWLGYVDGRCPTIPEAEAVDKVAAIVDRVRPDTIVTFGPDGVTGHADHRTVGRWAEEARRLVAPEATLLQAVLPPHFTTRYAELNAAFGIFMDERKDRLDGLDPDLHLRLQGEHLELKFQALKAQDSQTARLIEGVGAAAFRRWWSEEAFLRLDPAAADRSAA